MEHFDDIPIKDLNKLTKDEEEGKDEDPPGTEEDTAEASGTLDERLSAKSWKIRMQAYKEVAEDMIKAY